MLKNLYFCYSIFFLQKSLNKYFARKSPQKGSKKRFTKEKNFNKNSRKPIGSKSETPWKRKLLVTLLLYPK